MTENLIRGTYALPSPDDEQAYSDWLDTLTTQCTCDGVDKPCDGLLAGGLCDDLHLCSDAFAADLDLHNVQAVPAAAGGTESTNKPSLPLGTTD